MKAGERIDWRHMQRHRHADQVRWLLFLSFLAFDVFMFVVVWRMHS